MEILEKLIGSEWTTTPAADITTALNAPAAMRPMGLAAFMSAVVAAGGDGIALGELWKVGDGYIGRAEVSLLAGKLNEVAMFVASIPQNHRDVMGTTTLGAIATVIGAAALSTWQAQIAGPNAEAATEAGVVGWLGAQGWTWDGAAWTYTEPEGSGDLASG